MATIRLTPSTYTVSSSTYLSVSNADNMYTNTDSTTYATCTNSQNGTTTYYIYIRGFNFDAVPDNATINSFTVKFKASESGASTSTSYRPYMVNNTSTITGAASTVGTTASVITFTGVSATWSTIKGYGSDFGIRISNRRNNRNTTSYLYIYGAEILVDYTASNVPVTGVSLDKATDSVEVGSTTTLTATVAPSTATNKNVTWSTSNSSVATVSGGVVTGVSVGTARITVTTADGGFTDYCDVTVTQPVMYEYAPASSLQAGKNYILANGNTGSVYLLSADSGGSRQLQAVSATVSNGKISISGSVKSRCEFSCSLSNSSNPVTTCFMHGGQYLYCDNANGLRMNTVANIDRFWHFNSNKFWQFKNTASDGYTDASSEFKYYLTLSGSNFTDSHVDTTSIADSNIPLMYLYTESTGETDAIDVKLNGSWVEVQSAYKKVNGTWVLQTDLTTVFSSGTNYKRG